MPLLPTPLPSPSHSPSPSPFYGTWNGILSFYLAIWVTVCQLVQSRDIGRVFVSLLCCRQVLTVFPSRLKSLPEFLTRLWQSRCQGGRVRAYHRCRLSPRPGQVKGTGCCLPLFGDWTFHWRGVLSIYVHHLLGWRTPISLRPERLGHIPDLKDLRPKFREDNAKYIVFTCTRCYSRKVFGCGGSSAGLHIRYLWSIRCNCLTTILRVGWKSMTVMRRQSHWPSHISLRSIFLFASTNIVFHSTTSLLPLYCDIHCLGRYLWREACPSHMAAHYHIFSSLFYARLTSLHTEMMNSNAQKKEPCTDIEFSKIQAWTKGVDLFKKRILIIPIGFG